MNVGLSLLLPKCNYTNASFGYKKEKVTDANSLRWNYNKWFVRKPSPSSAALALYQTAEWIMVKIILIYNHFW
jgi:hypothetical protein